MALKPCQGCGKQVDTTAKACPGCGRPNPTVSGYAKLFATFFVLTLVIGGTIKACSCMSDAVDEARTGAMAPAKAMQAAASVKPIAVTADELYRAYDANEAAADERFKGKPLLVEGVIASIDKDIFDSTHLVLSARGALIGVNAALNRDETPTARKLKKRQRVEVQCRGGGLTLNTPTLDNCAITATWQ